MKEKNCWVERRAVTFFFVITFFKKTRFYSLIFFVTTQHIKLQSFSIKTLLFITAFCTFLLLQIRNYNTFYVLIWINHLFTTFRDERRHKKNLSFFSCSFLYKFNMAVRSFFLLLSFDFYFQNNRVVSECWHLLKRDAKSCNIFWEVK